MDSQSNEEEYQHSIWEIYRKEWATASPEKKTELNKRMNRWQELMKSGMSANQAYIQVMEQESDESPIYMAIEEESDYRVKEEPSSKRLAIASGPRMGKAPLVFLSLALAVAIVYGVIVTGDRNALNTELTSVQSVLASTQLELSSTKQTLASTQADLSSVQSELGATKQELLTTDAERLLYKETLDGLGVAVFSGKQPPPKGGGLSSIINLRNSSTAENPSWQQLISFLLNDPTDEEYYLKDTFVCSDFAEMLHNNAEDAGIKAAFVGIDFRGEKPPHAFNAFMTTNRGLVYVDCTGGTALDRLSDQSYDYSREYDRIAYVVKGKEYGMLSIHVFVSPEYSYYEENYDVLNEVLEIWWVPMGVVESIEIYW